MKIWRRKKQLICTVPIIWCAKSLLCLKILKTLASLVMDFVYMRVLKSARQKTWPSWLNSSCEGVEQTIPRNFLYFHICPCCDISHHVILILGILIIKNIILSPSNIITLIILRSSSLSAVQIQEQLRTTFSCDERKWIPSYLHVRMFIKYCVRMFWLWECL